MDNRVDGGAEADAETTEITTGLNKVTYKATKLWLEVLETFRSGVQLGKHRSLLRQYENCFVANAAVTWFNFELKKKFDAAITRQQTVHLLQKFYKAGVFTAVTNQGTFNGNQSAKTKETDFKDNRRLYKLVKYHPIEAKDEPNSQLQTSASNSKDVRNDYYVIINQLSTDQIFEIWKNAFVERFVQVVGYNVFTTFLKPGVVNGQSIKHNMTKISSNGIVVVSPVDDLPGWIINAMKCVTRRTNDGEYQHTSYPGFENDVFGLIRDYFNSFKANAPLLTFDLHDAFITTFVRAALFNGQDHNSLTTVGKKSCGNASKNAWIDRQHRFVQEQYPFSVSDSTENLLLDMLTPSPKKVHIGSSIRDDGVVKKGNSRPPRSLETIHSPGNDLDDIIAVEPMPKQSYNIEKYKLLPSTQKKTQEPIFLETAFTSERSPITRVISKAEIECSLGALRRPSSLRVGDADSAENFVFENPHLVLSPADMVNHPKYSRILGATELKATMSKVPSNTSFEAALKAPCATADPIETEFTRSLDPQILLNTNRPVPMTPPTRRPFRSQSAANLSDANQDRSNGYVPPLPAGSRASVDLGDEGFRQFLLKKFANSPSRSAQKTVKQLSTAKVKSACVMSPEGKLFAIVSFRLLTLLLPPQNRRYLHLLLQFMAKIAGSQRFMLDVANTTRRIVINEFSRAILGCLVEKEYDQYLAHQIVTFLMDNNQEVFDVIQEASLKKAAEDQISEQQIEKVPMAVTGRKDKFDDEEEDKENSANPKFACHKVSLDEYEAQRLLGGTAQSLRELLLACDTIDDAKERKRQLKKFRKEYPHIYAEKYGETENSEIESSNEVEKEISNPRKGNRIFRALF